MNPPYWLLATVFATAPITHEFHVALLVGERTSPRQTALSRNMNSIGHRIDKNHRTKVSNLRILREKTYGMGNDNGFWTVKEAARFLNIAPDTLRRYLKRNKKNVPPLHHPASKQIRIPKEEFIQWAMQQRSK